MEKTPISSMMVGTKRGRDANETCRPTWLAIKVWGYQRQLYSYIAAKVYNPSYKAAPVSQTSKKLFDTDTSVLALFGVGHLSLTDAVRSNVLLSLCQEFCLTDTIRQHKERHDRHKHGRKTLDKEQNPPRRQSTFDEEDGGAQRTAISVGQRRAGDENALSKADIMFWIEEGQVDWHTGIHGLEDTKDESDGDESRVILHGGLERREGGPAQDDAGAPYVRREVFPADDGPHGDDV